ncbi:MAG: response regulator transcription factor [Ardenticatenaceae bacterium]|nr:response regulator transcription factor [Ardenticatenaceae bacterium]MCB8948352.1 response regulator transcription factor [Ardenticatenaceae bacterium]
MDIFKTAVTPAATKEKLTRIVIADRFPVISNGIRYEVEKRPNLSVVGMSDRGDEALDLVHTLKPDILVTDVTLNNVNGIQLVRQLMSQNQEQASLPQILVFSEQRDKHHIWGMLSAGASGYLLKNETIDTLVLAIEAVSRGEVALSQSVQATLVALIPSLNQALSQREKDILVLLGQGLNNSEISQILQISESTVNHHISKAYHKLPTVRSRAEAVAWTHINQIT